MELASLEKLVFDSLDDLKAVDILVMDVSDKSSVTDRMIIATGTSARHNKALLEKLVERAKKESILPLGVEGQNVSNWMLVDLGDVVVHIMTAEAREYYNLEKLWGTEDLSDTSSAQSE